MPDKSAAVAGRLLGQALASVGKSEEAAKVLSQSADAFETLEMPDRVGTGKKDATRPHGKVGSGFRINACGTRTGSRLTLT